MTPVAGEEDRKPPFQKVYVCDPDCLVQPPNFQSAPKSIGEGASSLFGGRLGSPEHVSCSRATPSLVAFQTQTQNRRVLATQFPKSHPCPRW